MTEEVREKERERREGREKEGKREWDRERERLYIQNPVPLWNIYIIN